MKLYEELVAKQHPAVTWDYLHIQAALTAIDPALILEVHGHVDYLISGVPKEGMFPGLPWRTGCVEYGYYNTPRKCDFLTPAGWFYTPQYCLHQHLLERPDDNAGNS